MKFALSILIAICAMTANAQWVFSPWTQNNAVAAVVTQPAVYSISTNTVSTNVNAGVALTVTQDFSSGANRLALSGFSWYPNTAGLTQAMVNGVSMTLLGQTNFASDSVGRTAFYYLVNPSSGSQTISVKFNALINELDMGTLAVTNANQGGGASTFDVLTNSFSNTAISQWTNAPVTAANELMVGYSIVDDSPRAATILPGWTMVYTNSVGTGFHSGAMAIMPGQSSANVTNKWTWSGAAGFISVLGVGIKSP